MSRLLMLLVLLFPLAAHALSDPAEMLPNPAQEHRAEAIGLQLRCLVCQNQSIEDSDADLAKDLRHIVRTRIVAGDTDTQIMAFMTARYGDFVRMTPPFRPLTYLLWFSPLIALLTGTLAVLLTRARHRYPPAPLTPAEQATLNSLP